LNSICLRPVSADDAEAITRLLEGDVELALRTGSIPIPFTIESAHSFLSRANPQTTYAVVLGDALIGGAGLVGATNPVEIGYWIGKPYREKGYASAAVGLLLEEMKSRGVSRFAAEVFPDNAASMRVLEKHKFVRNGEVERDLPLRGGMRRLIRFELCLEV
jgi:RimJ/RimL family protein N-acetyltransferase